MIVGHVSSAAIVGSHVVRVSLPIALLITSAIANDLPDGLALLSSQERAALDHSNADASAAARLTQILVELLGLSDVLSEPQADE